MSLPFKIRDAVASDMGFVQHSWRSTFFNAYGASVPITYSDEDGGKRENLIPDREHYNAEMARLFERIFRHARVRVACDPEDPDVLLGFVVFTGPELHFIYVRQDFRRMGIAKALLDGLNIKQFTFATRQGVARLKPRDRGWRYAPRWTIH